MHQVDNNYIYNIGHGVLCLNGSEKNI